MGQRQVRQVHVSVIDRQRVAALTHPNDRPCGGNESFMRQHNTFLLAAFQKNIFCLFVCLFVFLFVVSHSISNLFLFFNIISSLLKIKKLKKNQ
jgi:hypothetical protein